MVADKTQIHMGEQSVLKYDVYTRYDTRYNGFKVKPDCPGFEVTPIKVESEKIERTVTRDDKRYVKAAIHEMILRPLEVGVHKIDPGSIKVSVLLLHDSINSAYESDSYMSNSQRYPHREERILQLTPFKITVLSEPLNSKQ